MLHICIAKEKMSDVAFTQHQHGLQLLCCMSRNEGAPTNYQSPQPYQQPQSYSTPSSSPGGAPAIQITVLSSCYR